VNQAGLHRFAHGRLTSWTRQDGLPSLNIHPVAEDQHGTIWVATRDAGLARIKDGKVVKVYTGSDGLPSNLMWFISGPQMKIACVDRNTNLQIIGVEPWMTHSVLQPPPGLLERLDISQPYLDITAFYEDREGNLWIGTQRRGFYRVRKQVIATYSKQHGLVDNNVYPIYEDRAGAIWIGAWYTGLSRFKDGVFTNYTKREGLASALVTAIGEDQAGRLWVAAYGDADHSGLRVFENGRFTVFERLAALSGQVPAICQDRAGTLWFGTDCGLVRYKDETLTTWTSKDGLAGDEVKVIIEDHAGHLWIGAYGGLTRFKDGRFTSWTERDGVPSNNLRALYEDREGVIWIGTYDSGLGRLEHGRFTRYTTKQGLFNDGVFQILEDARGNFWMSCNRGIYRVSKQELNEFAAGKRSTITSVAYGRGDGMLNPECNGGRWPAGIKVRDGKLWFPTQDGVAVIDPEAIPTNSEPPPVLIESFLLDRTPVSLDRPVRVVPGQENFEIQYTALSYINSEHLKFRYMLRGLDHEWVDAGLRRTAYYSHVPPGRYVFTVIAANSDGVWDAEGKSLSVVVLPPFYRTWWFMALAVLSVAGLLCLAWHSRVAHFERARAVQQAFARQLIASQEGERKRIAAELHDGLGQHLVVIKNLALMFLNAPAKRGEPRRQIEQISAEASQTINEVKEISYNLRPYQLDRIGLTKAVESIVKTASAASAIAFSAEIDGIDDVFPKESEINFYRIVQESLNNIVKHSQATEAGVTVRLKGNRVLLTIHDNGKGFAPDVSNPDTRPGGFGLIGIAERAQLLGGKPAIHSAPGQGTTINIEIALRDGQHDP
jgi:signal transduction histidine kinase/streptogramin lyase